MLQEVRSSALRVTVSKAYTTAYWCYSLTLIAVLTTGPMMLAIQAAGKDESGEGRAALRQRILDVAFPQIPDGTTRQKLSLRYLPSFRPEEELVLVFDKKSAHAEHFRASVRLDEALRSAGWPGKAVEPKAVAKLMRVRRAVLSLSSGDFQAQVSAFWDAVRNSSDYWRERSRKNLLQLDGTTYLVRYRDGTLDLRYQVLDSELGEAQPDSPISSWMVELRARLIGKQ